MPFPAHLVLLSPLPPLSPSPLLCPPEKPELRGITVACTSMLPSERALVHVPASLAYGAQGSFSFPNVPPNADLVCEVHLVGFDAPKQVGEARGEGVSG